MSDDIAASLVDPAIKVAYRKAAGESGRISRREAAAIIAAALDGKTVSLQELSDLFVIIEQADMSKGARKKFASFIDSRKAQEAKKLNLRSAMREVAGVLTEHSIVGKIFFKSSGTGASYEPGMYKAVARLVESGEIDASTFNYGAKGEREVLQNRIDGGSYEHTGNKFLLFDGGTRLERKVRIVHEATHAIQDFRNLPIKQKFAEADAYVADAIVIRTSRLHGGGHEEEIDFTGSDAALAAPKALIRKAALAIVDKMQSDKAKKTDRALYGALLEAIVADRDYASQQDQSLLEPRKLRRKRLEEDKLWKAAMTAP